MSQPYHQTQSPALSSTHMQQQQPPSSASPLMLQPLQSQTQPQQPNSTLHSSMMSGSTIYVPHLNDSSTIKTQHLLPNPSLNTMPANVLQSNNANTQLLKTSTGLANGTGAVQANQGNQPQLAQLSAGPKTNISISAIQHPQYIITNSNAPLNSSTIVSKASNTPVSMSMAGKPGQALLLTTKDGQQTTMVVQQGTAVSGVSANTTDVTSGSQPQILTQIVSNPNMLPAGMVLNMNPNRPLGQTFVNAAQAQRTMSPRLVINNGPIRLTPQVLQGARPGAPNNISLHPNLRGAILVKTDSGQFQFVNVAQPMPNTSATNVTIPQPQYRFQVPATGTPSSVASVVPTASGGTTLRTVPGQRILTLPASMASSLQRTAVITTGTGAQITSTNAPGLRAATMSTSVSQPLTIQTTTSTAASNSSTPSQMSPNTAKKKCKNFLSTLIRLASDQPEQVATNVKNLIQGLIDGNIQPEDFTVQLQRELNSSPQPCLVPFLKKSLPYLRHSLMIREMTIDGVKAPPQGTVQLPGQATLTPAGAQIQHIQISRQAPPTKPTVSGGTTVRLLSGGNLGTMTQTSQGTVLATGRPAVTPKAIHKYQKHAGASGTTITLTPANAPLATGTPLSSAIPRSNLSAQKKREILTKSKSPAGAKDRREPQKKKEEKDAFSSSLRDDDDINDVAAMGGVNLMEEHQRILATNAEFVGAQIRSCKDEPFLAVNPLQARINQIARKLGLEEVSNEVVALVSHAAEERLKTYVEKLGIIAEHRIENLKMDNRYEITQDVRGQIRFLDELDKLEKKRHEEQEREMLLRAAKSRSKLEDPEQLKLKQKAKEMQRAELEEARQREANETALLAIGPRKKLKLSNGANASFGSQFNSSSSGMNLSSLGFSSPNSKPQIRRVKRVNIRDLQFLMEQEKDTVRTPMLYRAYAK